MSVTWIYTIEEPAGDLLSIPVPPAPVRSFSRAGRLHWSRRILLSASMLGLCSSLAGVLLLLKGIVR